MAASSAASPSAMQVDGEMYAPPPAPRGRGATGPQGHLRCLQTPFVAQVRWGKRACQVLHVHIRGFDAAYHVLHAHQSDPAVSL